MGYLLISSYDKICDVSVIFYVESLNIIFFRFSIVSVSGVIILFLQVGNVCDICC